MAYLERIRLGFGNNLVIGNSGPAMKLDKLIHTHNPTIQVESFGLFDSAAPNFNTYYPEVEAKDLTPNDAEFVEPVYRALSEVTVHKRYNPIDFSMNGALKKSMGLLRGQTIYPNHEAMVGNELGAVSEVSWEDSFKQGNILIPAGINAKMKIDGKSHPRIARGINMNPPSIHSTSVTVEFLWEKSHDIPADEFFSKLATYDKSGQQYRRIATEIKKYDEISFVSHGADPFAQKKNEDGGIANPQHANRTYNSEEKKAQRWFFFDFKTDTISNNEKIQYLRKLMITKKVQKTIILKI
jgi:hypothetical protein